MFFHKKNLVFHPFLYLGEKGFWFQDFYYWPKRENLNQKLGFPPFVIVDGAAIGAGFVQPLYFFLITGKVKHGPFQSVSLCGDFQY